MNYNEDNKEKNNLDELKETLPHFCHLRPICNNNRKSVKCIFPNDFCYHIFYCLEDFNIKGKLVEINEKKRKNIHSTCCCYDENITKEDNIKHNQNTIFSTKYFTSESINNKNSIIKINIQKSYIPQYDKMIFLVGKNKNIFDIIEALNSDKQYLNIHGDTIENLKIFINALIEYFLERNYKEEKHVILDEFNIENFKLEPRYNGTYFIYIQDPKYIQDIKELNLIKYKIILYSEKEYKDDNNFKNIEINPEPFEPVPGSEKKKDNKGKVYKEYIPNCYVKYQHKVSIREIWEK